MSIFWKLCREIDWQDGNRKIRVFSSLLVNSPNNSSQTWREICHSWFIKIVLFSLQLIYTSYSVRHVFFLDQALSCIISVDYLVTLTFTQWLQMTDNDMVFLKHILYLLYLVLPVYQRSCLYHFDILLRNLMHLFLINYLVLCTSIRSVYCAMYIQCSCEQDLKDPCCVVCKPIEL